MNMNESANPNPLFMPRTYLSTQSNKTGSWRFARPRYDEKTSPCSAACPAGEDIARIEMLATQGFFKEAWETILLENPFPSVCGRVCFHPCEDLCNRREFDAAVAIHSLERFLADTAIRYGIKPDLEKRPPRKERIAVVGAGPAGLSAAWFLTLLGYACRVFEASAEAGGILRWGIPQYRLPVAALRHDIQQIEAQGVSIVLGKPVTAEILEALKKDFDAVFMACGDERARRESDRRRRGPGFPAADPGRSNTGLQGRVGCHRWRQYRRRRGAQHRASGRQSPVALPAPATGYARLRSGSGNGA
jgi:NADPH-dependent glutamate synthase beta subunit-like oxidoreductase